MEDLNKKLELLIDYLKGVWVKKRYVMICSWLICPVGFLYVASLPDVYESEATIYIDTNSVLQPLLRGLAIQTNPKQEVAMMVKTLLSRPNIEKIARNTDLDVTATTPAQYEGLIASLSNKIDITAEGRENLYSISYSAVRPELAKSVVQETLNLLVEGTLGNSRKGTDTANKFIDEQIDEYERRLSASEQRLADFKRQYSEVLPNQGSFYQKYDELEEALDATRLTIKESEQQIETMSDTIEEQQVQSLDEFAVRSSKAEPAITTRYDNRILSLEAQLDQLLLKYTERHPDVVEANSLLDSIRVLRQVEIEEFIASPGDNTPLEVGSISNELGLEVSRQQSQVSSLKVREANYQEKILNLRQKIDLVPQIESELTALNRDYGITKKKYEELLARRESAELSQRAGISADDVQFRVIEPPLAPQIPTGPKRIVIYSAVLFLGFGAGIVLAFLVSQINPILSRPKQLTTLTTYPVLGVVGHLDKTKINQISRARILAFLVSSGLIFVFYAALVSAELMQINLFTRIFQ
jgi:polysaccharide chain length determinant protein (PEP-CTERM system associated)